RPDADQVGQHTRDRPRRETIGALHPFPVGGDPDHAGTARAGITESADMRTGGQRISATLGRRSYTAMEMDSRECANVPNALPALRKRPLPQPALARSGNGLSPSG